MEGPMICSPRSLGDAETRRADMRCLSRLLWSEMPLQLLNVCANSTPPSAVQNTSGVHVRGELTREPSRIVPSNMFDWTKLRWSKQVLGRGQCGDGELALKDPCSTTSNAHAA